MAEQSASIARRQLMERAQNGDKDAFRALVTEVGPLIARFIRRRVADPHELEDVLQETLLAIYESLHTYEPARPLEPWLFAIAAHVAAKHFRRYWSRASWQELAEVMPEQTVDGPEKLPVELRQALGGLSQFQLEALLMTKVEGLSLSEASERTGVSVGALKARVHRAFTLLKRAMLE